MYAYDKDLLELSRKCVEDYIKRRFFLFKKDAIRNYKYHHEYFKEKQEYVIGQRYALFNLLYMVDNATQTNFYKEITGLRFDDIIDCSKDKKFLDKVECIYTHKGENLKLLESVLRKIGVCYDFNIYHSIDYLKKFWLAFCMKYDVLFNERDKYLPIYISMIANIERADYRYRLLEITLYKLYTDDNYIIFLAPYFNMDIYKNLMMEIDTKKKILSNIEFKKLKSSDFGVDSNFDLVFKHNKQRWNLVKQIGDCLLENQMINLTNNMQYYSFSSNDSYNSSRSISKELFEKYKGFQVI